MADIPSWPATLPQPRASGYGIQPVSAFVRTDMDDGAARQRRRFTSTPSRIAVAWQLSLLQYATFEGFVAYDINDGASWFAVDLLSGMGISRMQARFMEDPPFKAALSQSRVYFDVTATLEIKAMPIVTRDQYEMLGAYFPADIEQMSDALHYLAHVHLPGDGRWN